jgi:hypothetical protein
MIEEACVAIDEVTERDRRHREAKYARRNKMRYIDQLLNELEMLNLADQREVPQAISAAVDRLMTESAVQAILEMPKPDSVIQTMDVLYEIQDSLMFTQIDDE